MANSQLDKRERLSTKCDLRTSKIEVKFYSQELRCTHAQIPSLLRIKKRQFVQPMYARSVRVFQFILIKFQSQRVSRTLCLFSRSRSNRFVEWKTTNIEREFHDCMLVGGKITVAKFSIIFRANFPHVRVSRNNIIVDRNSSLPQKSLNRFFM